MWHNRLINNNISTSITVTRESCPVFSGRSQHGAACHPTGMMSRRSARLFASSWVSSSLPGRLRGLTRATWQIAGCPRRRRCCCCSGGVCVCAWVCGCVSACVCASRTVWLWSARADSSAWRPERGKHTQVALVRARKMELSAVGDRVFAAEAILKRRVRKVSYSSPACFDFPQMFWPRLGSARLGSAPVHRLRAVFLRPMLCYGGLAGSFYPASQR